MMSNLVHPQQTDRFSELRLISKSLVFLALLTGLIYLRVFIVEIIPVMRETGSTAVEIAKLVLLIAAMLGLLATWRYEMVGSVTAVLAGLIFGILIYVTTAQNPLLLTIFYSSPFVISGGLQLACCRRQQKD
ncbi:MAG: hypothetical protein H6658_20085 [Ardenticatenaceae bacterium]|nr:hypothetical protein [Ardenticatenaceae bacterium]